jgi:uncharacterized phage protein (TIGR02220 family)
MIGSSDDEMKVLIAKQYILPFESGVVVIKHWKIHNYIQKDRYHPSGCPERSLVKSEKGKPYELLDTKCIHECIQDGNIDKVRLDKVRLDKVSIKDNADVSDDTSPKEIALDKEKKKIDYTPIIHEAIDYLNQKANTRYKYTSKNTITHIKARVNEGFTVEDFKQVIDKKCRDWGNDAKMSKYLRPETLFGTKFEGYLNEREKTNGNIQRAYRESQQKSQGNADAEWDEQLRNWCARQKSEPRPWDV